LRLCVDSGFCWDVLGQTRLELGQWGKDTMRQSQMAKRSLRVCRKERRQSSEQNVMYRMEAVDGN
jgi:hypothetical protein